MRIGKIDMASLCLSSGDLTEEEKEMFDFREHKWLFFQNQIEMYVREFPNLGVYIFGVRIAQMANVLLGADKSTGFTFLYGFF